MYGYSPLQEDMIRTNTAMASPGRAEAIEGAAREASGSPQVLAEYGFSSGVANENVAHALGIMRAIEDHGAATPAMAKDFQSALDGMSPTQRDARARSLQQGAGGVKAADRDIYTALGGSFMPGRANF